MIGSALTHMPIQQPAELLLSGSHPILRHPALTNLVPWVSLSSSDLLRQQPMYTVRNRGTQFKVSSQSLPISLPSYWLNSTTTTINYLSYWLAWFFSDSLPQKSGDLDHLGHLVYIPGIESSTWHPGSINSHLIVCLYHFILHFRTPLWCRYSEAHMTREGGWSPATKSGLVGGKQQWMELLLFDSELSLSILAAHKALIPGRISPSTSNSWIFPIKLRAFLSFSFSLSVPIPPEIGHLIHLWPDHSHSC